ncbi:MAG: hypothetical protein K9M11_02010 [Candidatus Pacebacteria bacterium]|nr:hypothetical protein [Candidatus Paceibacterota bacterium]
MKSKTVGLSRFIFACISGVGRFVVSSWAIICSINDHVDQTAKNLSLKLDFEDKDGEESIMASFTLGALWFVALALLWFLFSLNISLFIYPSFGYVLPLFEHIKTMSNFERTANTCAVPLTTVYSMMFLFHFLRHVGRRMRH